MAVRPIGTVATLILLMTCAVSCSGHTNAERQTSAALSRQARFQQFGLTFAYPAEWKAQTWPNQSSFSTLITYLSPLQLNDPCTRTETAQRIEIACSSPITVLPPGGVLVSWFGWGVPRPGPRSPTKGHGCRLTIRARVADSAPMKL